MKFLIFFPSSFINGGFRIFIVGILGYGCIWVGVYGEGLEGGVQVLSGRQSFSVYISVFRS